MAYAVKVLLVIILLTFVLVSCSPKKTEYDESRPSVGSVSSIVEDNPYGPKEIYELNALDADFLDRSFQLPYYKDKTHEELLAEFMRNPDMYCKTMNGFNAVLPDSVCFGRGNFIYDKRTGKILRTCKDPQCRHSSSIPNVAADGTCTYCPFTELKWKVINDRLYFTAWGLGSDDISAMTFTSDFSFTDYYYVDFPKACVLECVAADGDFILENQEYVPYIDENGVQRKKQGNFKIIRYDPQTKDTVTLLFNESPFSVKVHGNTVFCVPLYADYAYAFYNDFSEIATIHNFKRILMSYEGKVYYITDAGETFCFDVSTGEIAEWAIDKDSPLLQIYTRTFCDGKLYFTKYNTAAEINNSDILDKKDKSEAYNNTMDSEIYGYYAPIVYRCDPDGGNVEPVYYAPHFWINEIEVDGDVLYMNGRLLEGGARFAAYDMSSGVELRIYAPTIEYHYPGEYGYDENRRRGVN